MTFDPNTTEGIIAIIFIVVCFILLVLILITCIVCWCWRYKLHKRKEEIKTRDAEQGVVTTKTSGCKCCGCWVYCCRGCRCCCEPAAEKVVVVQPSDATAGVTVPVAINGGGSNATTIVTPSCGCSGNTNGGQFGWSKDVYVYNNGATSATNTSSIPVNFNNRWSSGGGEGRLVLNGAGISPGVQPYGGIYSSVLSSSDQFLLRSKR